MPQPKGKTGGTQRWVKLAAATAAVAAVVVGWRYFTADDSSVPGAIRVPKLSAQAATGESLFNANCAECHGQNAGGSDRGPPLVHDIYNPGHHADAAFLFAARQGVRAHHWNFGDMPPQTKVSNADIAAIVRYVRELQDANGITYKPHRM